jgi:hypothetical protein
LSTVSCRDFTPFGNLAKLNCSKILWVYIIDNPSAAILTPAQIGNNSVECHDVLKNGVHVTMLKVLLIVVPGNRTIAIGVKNMEAVSN